MDFWKRLFSTGKPPRPVEETAFTRSSPAGPATEPGTERRAFLQQAAMILDCEPEALDLSAPLVEHYGCADLDVSECVQAAEEAWGVQLMPNPMTADDFAYLLRRLTTLQAIINDAERRAAARR